MKSCLLFLSHHKSAVVEHTLHFSLYESCDHAWEMFLPVPHRQGRIVLSREESVYLAQREQG